MYIHVSVLPLTTPPLDGAFVSSSKARWAADAASTTTSDATTTVTAADAAASTAESTTNSTDSVAQVISELSAQGDFASLGLGGHSPVGLVQSSLEYLHVQAQMPWWLAIVACTVALRVVMFPLIVRVQANAARLNNIQPQTEKLMEKIKRYNKVLQCNFKDDLHGVGSGRYPTRIVYSS